MAGHEYTPQGSVLEPELMIEGGAGMKRDQDNEGRLSQLVDLAKGIFDLIGQEASDRHQGRHHIE